MCTEANNIIYGSFKNGNSFFSATVDGFTATGVVNESDGDSDFTWIFQDQDTIEARYFDSAGFTILSTIYRINGNFLFFLFLEFWNFCIFL
jgi:hypothetical protein